VPRSRLLLKARSLSCPKTRSLVQARFDAEGVPAKRVELLAQTVSQRSHLAQYDQVDIALDPFPYNGTTTTCEALWMGVPVITMSGRVHASRVGASLLTRIGLQELIARTPESYVDAAVRMAGDPAWLQEFRRSARDRMLDSSLANSSTVARALEAAYHKMLRETQDPPSDEIGARRE
jgi:predicted O-linked N-acetylglucosamine transferase (SPINDLY family)